MQDDVRSERKREEGLDHQTTGIAGVGTGVPGREKVPRVASQGLR